VSWSERSGQFRCVMMYAQDARGLGHVTRSLTIARHVLARYPDCVAYLATKSLLAGLTLPERCDYIKLPTFMGPAASPWTEEQVEAAKDHFYEIRSEMLRDAALGLVPDLVLVDHEPLGARAEFRAGLCALKARHPTTRLVFGLRDIMDDAEHIRALWRDTGVYDALENLYDGIAVYGCPDVHDVAEAYALPPSVRCKLHYCGYIVRNPPAIEPRMLRRQYGLPENGPLVVATVGSGSDGYPVLEAAQGAVARLEAWFPGLHAILVTGPLMPAAQRAALEARATATCRVVSHADNFALMTAADAIVSMGGYNSVCEALVLRRPLVIVPRATHKVEQRIRAETLAARGLAGWVHPRELDAASLAEALAEAWHRDGAAHARRVQETLAFDGAARLTEYLSQWLNGD
jgi:predicted glycosyltransferase